MGVWNWTVAGWQNNQDLAPGDLLSKHTEYELLPEEGLQRIIFRSSYSVMFAADFENPIPAPAAGLISTVVGHSYGATSVSFVYDNWHPIEWGAGWVNTQSSLGGSMYWTGRIPQFGFDMQVRRAASHDDNRRLKIFVDETYIPVGGGPAGFVTGQPQLVGWSELQFLRVIANVSRSST